MAIANQGVMFIILMPFHNFIWGLSFIQATLSGLTFNHPPYPVSPRSTTYVFLKLLQKKIYIYIFFVAFRMK